MDWRMLSMALVGQDATKAALKAAIKRCDPPHKKSGPKTKQPDIRALRFIGRTSVSAILAEGNIKRHRSDQLEAEQRKRQRALKKVRPSVLRLLAEIGIDTDAPDWIDDFIRLMSGGPNPRQANTEINPTTVIGADE
jgi:hypothetical protein